jgi:phthalate 4,5-dioxygenase
MLPSEENDLITRTDNGAPLGQLLRRYWLPALLSEEIPAPDAPPAQVRILGEDLIAFRDTQGRIGLLEEHCSHRGTSLFYGRNEECGLRCIYHGWKYDVEGNVLDTPAEPATSTFKERVKQRAYPCVEAAGIVFAYLGPREEMPLFPDYEWARVPVENTYVAKSFAECNYLQGLEGECDSAHLTYLHKQIDEEGRRQQALLLTPPIYDLEETDFGLRLLAFRHPDPEQTYLRVSSFVLPVSCWVPVRNKECHMYVPIDDSHAWRYDLGWMDRPVREDEIPRRSQIGPDFRRIRTQANHYLQDREVQRKHTFTGITDFLNHDACATETMGPVYDRTREHLGVSDKAVIGVRKRILDAVRAFQRGEEPPHLIKDPAENCTSHIDTIGEVIPTDGDWHRHFPHLTYSGRQPTPVG